MIELQRRLAQDYQRQREIELNRQMAQTAIRDDPASDQTMLVRRTDVEGIGDGLPQLQQTSGPAARDLQAADRVYVTDHSDQGHPRSVTRGQLLATSWPQSEVTGTGQYGDSQQSNGVKMMAVGQRSATVDEFVQQLKSRNAK